MYGYMISGQCRKIRISKFSLRYKDFVDIGYNIPYLGLLGAPATFQPPDGSSLLVLDPLGRSVLLRDCLGAHSCWSSAAFCCCSGPALDWTAGWSRWAVLISSYCSSSDLVMIHMLSVKYAFRLSLACCLDAAGDASVFAGPGAEPARPAATDRHCGATAA
jgi:hypothetical protein